MPSMFTDSGKHVNGDARSKKQSVTESLHSRARFSDIGDEESDRSVFYNNVVYNMYVLWLNEITLVSRSVIFLRIFTFLSFTAWVNNIYV